MPANYLRVPMYVDALFLADKETIASSSADFSGIPYNDGSQDFNYETPYISEAFLKMPFQETQVLPAGVHLHWKLPAALSRASLPKSEAESEKEKMQFRHAPDRWLVIRSKDGIDKEAWIVESNYLWPADTKTADAISFPLISAEKGQPFRYMGRCYPVDANINEDINQEDISLYFNQLTALGQGDPAFAAFYPNCYSVFGFHDAEITSVDLYPALTYEIYGWYSANLEDPLAALQKNGTATAKDLLDNFNWEVNGVDASANIPVYEGVICYGKVSQTGFVSPIVIQENPISIAVGNSGVEALAAWLETSISDACSNQLKDLLYVQPGDIQLDREKKILQAMHKIGFTPFAAGSIWDIKIEDADLEAAGKTILIDDAIFALPPYCATLLNDINVCQQACDRDADEVTSRKQQLFTDWYKYMVSNYHNDLQQQLPEADLVRCFIEEEIKNNRFDKNQYLEDQLDGEKKKLYSLANSFNNNNNNSKIDFAQTPPADATFTIANDTALAGTPVAVFSGDENCNYSYEVSGAVDALSAWLYVDKEQPDNEASLLCIQADSDIGYKSTALPEANIYINGVLLNEIPLSVSVLPKGQWLHLYIQFSAALSVPNLTFLFFSRLKGRLAAFRCVEVLQEEALFCELNMLGLKKMELIKDEAPRYWTPNEPAVLLAGSEVKPGGRDVLPQKLTCFTYEFGFTDFSQMAKSYKTLDIAFPLDAVFTSTNHSWNPAILQWQVILEDHLQLASPYSRQIDSSYIKTNFSLWKNNGDFIYNSTEVNTTTDTFKMYTGATMLSDHAKTQMQMLIASSLLAMTDEDIEAILNMQKGTYEQPGPITECVNTWKKQDLSLLNPGFFIALYAAFYNLFGNNLPLLEALNVLNTTDFLSQALGGFNAALLQLHQAPQFPVRDPVGFSETLDLTDSVFSALAGEMKNAPLPLNTFNPLRTGAMYINQLAVLDNFGQSIPIQINNNAGQPVCFSEVFSKNQHPNMAFLPPRIIQPVRLNFRWLSAANEHADEMEMNSHPASSPVCGWFAANNLDHSLMVYDAEGCMLGIIQSVADSPTQWTAIPGNEPISGCYKVEEQYIENDYLQNTVNLLLNRNPAEFESFMELLEETLDQVEPADFAQHTDLALLMSKPIAVVRCSLSLEVKGLPAVNQGWDYFVADIGSTQRNTNGWENIQFPVYLGEPGMLNDGVLGYWSEADTRVFKSTHTTDNDPDADWYEVHETGATPVFLSVGAEKPQTFTMLMDPRGLAHAVSGIVPAKGISIPAGQFKPALKKMSAVFFTRPLLMPEGEIALSLPAEPGYSWSWVSEKEVDKQIIPMETKENFSPAMEAVEGWLKLTVTN